MCRDMKDSGIDWIGEINTEWSIVKIAKLAQFINGYAFNGEDLTIENEVPVIRIGDIQEGGVNLDGCLKYKKDKRLYNYSIQSKDVLIAMSGATTGKTAFINEVDSVAYINQRVGIIRNSKYSKYINYSLNTGEFRKYIDLLADGSAQPNISTKGIMNYYLALPNKGLDNIINYIDKKVSQIDDIISKQKSLIEKYKSYKRSLITETVTKGLNKNASMKNSGIEWIGEIPSHWDVTITKNISNKITDGAHVSPETENGVYDFISVVNLDNNSINFNGCLKTSEVSYIQMVKNGCKPQRGDILISKDGTVGKSVVIDYDREFVVASSLVIVTPNKKMISYFLNYLIQSNCVQEQLNSFMKGSGLRRVSVKNNGKLYVTVPSISEQEDIVAFLDKKCNAIDSAIYKKEKLVKKLESYKKSLIYECVTGKRGVN